MKSASLPCAKRSSATSATGVAFTRDAATGKKEFYGDYLVNAQGEDVVAGIRNTSPIAELKAKAELIEAQIADLP